jgi:hypothetical protein
VHEQQHARLVTSSALLTESLWCIRDLVRDIPALIQRRDRAAARRRAIEASRREARALSRLGGKAPRGKMSDPPPGWQEAADEEKALTAKILRHRGDMADRLSAIRTIASKCVTVADSAIADAKGVRAIVPAAIEADAAGFEAQLRQCLHAAKEAAMLVDLSVSKAQEIPPLPAFVYDPETAEVTLLTAAWTMLESHCEAAGDDLLPVYKILRCLPVTARGCDVNGQGQASKKRRRKRTTSNRERPLTLKERITIEVVARHHENLSAAAAELGKDRKTVEENYERAVRKLKQISGHKSRSVSASQYRRGSRGEDDA